MHLIARFGFFSFARDIARSGPLDRPTERRVLLIRPNHFDECCSEPVPSIIATNALHGAPEHLVLATIEVMIHDSCLSPLMYHENAGASGFKQSIESLFPVMN
jgi:hypothetical protein